MLNANSYCFFYWYLISLFMCLINTFCHKPTHEEHSWSWCCISESHSTVLCVYSHHHVAAVQPHAADQGKFGVGPVQTLIEVVNRQTWKTASGRFKGDLVMFTRRSGRTVWRCFTSWPLDVFFNQCLSHGSVHSCCFYLGMVAPISPVHFPKE